MAHGDESACASAMTLQGISSAKLRDSRSELRAAVSKLRVVQSRSDEGLTEKKEAQGSIKNNISIVHTDILHAFHTHRSAKQDRVVRTHRSKNNEQQCSHRPPTTRSSHFSATQVSANSARDVEVTSQREADLPDSGRVTWVMMSHDRQNPVLSPRRTASRLALLPSM